MIVGYMGHFAANLLRAYLLREREFLADASSVQYTRQPDGLLKALRKISQLRTDDKGITHLHTKKQDSVAHLFIFPAYKSLENRWFATHPPLVERISRLIEMSLQKT